MYLNLQIVMNSRRAAKAANPLAGNEDKIQVSKNVLSNTVEQLVLTIILQITSLHYLTPVQVLNIVPLFNALFLIGRILFWIGYPKRRSLGFALNITPCLIMVLFAGYQFTVRHLDLNTVSLFNLKL